MCHSSRVAALKITGQPASWQQQSTSLVWNTCIYSRLTQLRVQTSKGKLCASLLPYVQLNLEGKNKATVASRFRDQLIDLVARLDSTEMHFVRCATQPSSLSSMLQAAFWLDAQQALFTWHRFHVGVNVLKLQICPNALLLLS